MIPTSSGIRLNAFSHVSVAISRKGIKKRISPKMVAKLPPRKPPLVSLTPRFSEVDIPTASPSTVSISTVFLPPTCDICERLPIRHTISKGKLHDSLLNLRAPSAKVTEQLAILFQQLQQTFTLAGFPFPLAINLLQPRHQFLPPRINL